MTRWSRFVFTLALLTLALCLSCARFASAETVAPTGHWEGAIHAPFGDVVVAVDLALEDGRLVGRFTNPSEQIHGFPLAAVTVDGRVIEMRIKAGADTQTFKGTLSQDGRSISGNFLLSVYGVPFDLTRSGDARFEPAPTSPAIARSFEGVWRGDLAVRDTSLPIVLTMTNRDEQTAVGMWGSDEAVQIPVTIGIEGSRLTIRSPVTRGAFTATIDSDGTRLVGVFTEGPLEVPLTLLKTR
jgi:hypothetical protein